MPKFTRSFSFETDEQRRQRELKRFRLDIQARLQPLRQQEADLFQQQAQERLRAMSQRIQATQQATQQRAQERFRVQSERAQEAQGFRQDAAGILEKYKPMFARARERMTSPLAGAAEATKGMADVGQEMLQQGLQRDPLAKVFQGLAYPAETVAAPIAERTTAPLFEETLGRIPGVPDPTARAIGQGVGTALFDPLNAALLLPGVAEGRLGLMGTQQVGRDVARMVAQQAAKEAAEKAALTTTRTAAEELLGTRIVRPGLTKVDRTLNVLKETVGIGVPEERVATPIMRERQRVQRVVENLANRLGLQAGHRVQRAFRPDEAGRIASLPGRPTVQDLAARLPEFELNAEQQKTMQWLRQEFEKYGAAYKEVFGEPIGPRPDIVEGGFYLPRGRAALEGADEPLARVVVGGGRRGTKIGAERHAVFASQAEGIEAGYRYASFAEAAHSFAKTMGDRVLEEHTSNLFKQAIDEAGQLLGETQAARLLRQNPLLKEAVGGLRQRVSGLARSIDNTYRSLKLAGMEERRIFTRLQRLEEQADLKRPTVYDIVASLEKKGVFSMVTKKKKRYFWIPTTTPTAG